MNKLLSFFNKYASLKSAFFTVAILYAVIIPILQRLDQPLNQLASEAKLDYHKDYDVSTVTRLYDAYGEQGRGLYAWDLLVDTAFPVAVSVAAILSALIVARKPLLQKLLVVFPLIFVAADIMENAFLLMFIMTYPNLPPTLVVISNFFTRVKLFTIFPAFAELYIFLPIGVILATVGFVRNQLKARGAA